VVPPRLVRRVLLAPLAVVIAVAVSIERAYAASAAYLARLTGS